MEKEPIAVEDLRQKLELNESGGYLRRLAEKWWARIGFVMQLVSLVPVHVQPPWWPELLEWWALFWIGTLLVFLAQYRVWRDATEAHEGEKQKLEAERDKLMRAFEGEDPAMGDGLKYVRQEVRQRKPLAQDIQKVMESTGQPKPLPYDASVVVKVVDGDVPPYILVRWNGPVLPGIGHYRDDKAGENSGARGRTYVDSQRTLYKFASVGETIPEGTLVSLSVNVDNLGIRCIGAEIWSPSLPVRTLAKDVDDLGRRVEKQSENTGG